MKKVNNNQRVNELERDNARLIGENEKLKANVDYIAMMTDVDIEEVSTDEPEV